MRRKKLIILITSSLLLSSCGNDTNDVKKVVFKTDDGQNMTEIATTNQNNYVTLNENANFKFEFRNDSDVLKIYDKRNSYTWHTGLDLGPKAYEDYLGNLTRNERKTFYSDNPVIEMSTTDYYFSLMTSLITLQYYAPNETSYIQKYIGSSFNGVESKLYKIDNSHYKLDVDFSKCKTENINVQIGVDMYFDDTGFDIQILNENIKGDGANRIRNILICPFLGATGGTKGTYDEDSGGYISEDKPWENGYVLVPDGSGSIIEMTNNNVANLSSYVGYVYGKDPSQSTNYTIYVSEVMQIKDAKMPVFGIAKTDSNAAFVSYAKNGAEYMSIMASPDNSNNLQYSWATPQFSQNFEYTEIYNKAGNSYSKFADKRNEYDIDIKYDFLANENANYVGMALDYKNYLENENILKKKEYDYKNVPARIDFIMSEVEDAVVGNKEVVVTNVDNVDYILNDIKDNLHIDNGVSSLLGWQKGGKTTQHPGKANFISKIGSKGSFKDLIEKYENNFKIGFQQDYYLINTEQMAFLDNAAKHINGNYNKVYDFTRNFINEFSILRPDKSYNYIKSQYDKLKKVGMDAITVEGVSSYLVSHHTTISREMAKNYIVAAFKYLDDNNVNINAIEPNMYLWEYVDRYFDADPFDSVLLIETKEVPFLQIVLQGNMELYSKYCNFSFYDDNAICTMVDFNMYPSFMLTYESAYYLLQTNSNIYFSTQYEIYKSLIEKVYNKVNSALKEVINAKWINREENNNVVINTYDNGKKIIINYNKEAVNVNGKNIAAESFEVM